jgi:hypothetical protein
MYCRRNCADTRSEEQSVVELSSRFPASFISVNHAITSTLTSLPFVAKISFIVETVYYAIKTVLGNPHSLTRHACGLIEANHRTSRIMDLGRHGRTAPRFSVVPAVHSFTQANRIGIVLRLLLCAEKAGLLKVAAVEASPHSGLRPQARTHPLWVLNGAALARGTTT